MNSLQTCRPGRLGALALLTLGAVFTTALANANANPCADVVADTVAEMRAGATGWWSEEVENLVRAAAGSACVKSLSGRYGAVDTSSEAGALTSSPLPASAGSSAQEAAGSAATDADDESWSVGGLTIRSMSGSPGKKPYQRSRISDDQD